MSRLISERYKCYAHQMDTTKGYLWPTIAERGFLFNCTAMGQGLSDDTDLKLLIGGSMLELNTHPVVLEIYSFN